MDARSAPLTGIRVIDMTSVLMGLFASQSLGEMGADVIKIEPPQGDVVRQIGPARHEGMGPLFLNANRCKRSVVLDLKQPAGVDALRALLRDADVLMTNVRPQAMERLGLGYDAVAAINPGIVYAALGRLRRRRRRHPRDPDGRCCGASCGNDCGADLRSRKTARAR